jgi:pyrroline-5-carboxylate reductase
VILCVKPQDVNNVLAHLKGRMSNGQLIISIVAGTRLDTISDGLGFDAIVRVMPNTPAQYGEGMSVWTATPAVTKAQLESSRAILGAFGKELYMHISDY